MRGTADSYDASEGYVSDACRGLLETRQLGVQLYPHQGAYSGALLPAALDKRKDRCVTLAAAIETKVEAGLSDVPPERSGRARSPKAP
jgi:hypothetical protein